MGTIPSNRLVSIVIVNYNGLAFLDDCLTSIAHSDHKNLTVFLVDNASTDTSMHYVETHYPDVTIIRNENNCLFAKGANIGVRCALEKNPDYIFLLNPDVTLSSPCISTLVSFLDAHPDVTACQPKLLFKENPEYIQSCGIRCALSGRAWDHRMGEKDGPHLPPYEEVLGVTGGAMFLRSTSWSQSDGFCERFGMYYEDVDLCLRLRKKGGSFYCVNKAHAYHVFSGIVGTGKNTRKYFYTERNCYWVVLRNYPLSKVFKSYLLSIPASLGMCFFNMVNGRLAHSWFCILGVAIGGVSFVLYFPRVLLQAFSPSEKAPFQGVIDEDRILPPRPKRHWNSNQ